MPKRWRIVGVSNFGYELLDEEGLAVYRSERRWSSADAVDEELYEIEVGDIEFPDGKVKGPKNRFGRRPRP